MKRLTLICFAPLLVCARRLRGIEKLDAVEPICCRPDPRHRDQCAETARTGRRREGGGRQAAGDAVDRKSVEHRPAAPHARGRSGDRRELRRQGVRAEQHSAGRGRPHCASTARSAGAGTQLLLAGAGGRRREHRTVLRAGELRGLHAHRDRGPGPAFADQQRPGRHAAVRSSRFVNAPPHRPGWADDVRDRILHLVRVRAHRAGRHARPRAAESDDGRRADRCSVRLVSVLARSRLPMARTPDRGRRRKRS